MGSVLAVLSRQTPPDSAALERMAATTPHRGGLAGSVSIGNAVLAATCRSEMRDGWTIRTADLAVAFSGVLDNAEELARAWSATRSGSTDPASIAALGIRALGIDEAAQRMRGVFAVVASDGRTLWAFRDHLGFHPLIYREETEGLIVGVEPKQVVAATGASGEPDLDVLASIFYGSFEAADRSAIAGVMRLPPATVIEGSGGRSSARRYWDPEPLLEAGRLAAGEIRERFHHLMEQAVRRCLSGQAVVSLSGGVDSPAVAAFAAPLHAEREGEPLHALSALYPDYPSVDETRYIEVVARDLGLVLHTFVPSRRPTDGLGEWARLFDGPVPIVAFAQVLEDLELARELGFRTMLSGEMEEFVFEMRQGVFAHLLTHGRIGAALQHARALRSRGHRIGRLARKAGLAIVPRGVRKGVRRIRSTTHLDLPAWIDPAEAASRWGDPATRSWRSQQLVAFAGSSPSLSADDTLQHVAGVRERRPFADVDLWEFALGLPAEIKHGDPAPKALLRGWLRGKVPDIVLDRRDKTAFDEHILGNIDYEALRAWLLDPAGPPMPGVDYGLLAGRLAEEKLTLREFVWAKDLAGVHAFLSAWDSP